MYCLVCGEVPQHVWDARDKCVDDNKLEHALRPTTVLTWTPNSRREVA
jgi:hypothetical protein